jgi:DNA ligase 1
MKPMLLYRKNPTPDSLPYPVDVSPKLDGIRCIMEGSKAKSRTLKDIPNSNIRKYLNRGALSGLDGELIMGAPTEPGILLKSNSVVMSHDKPLPSEWGYYVFDYQDTTKPYEQRRADLEHFVNHEKDNHIRLVLSRRVHNPAELLAFEQEMLDLGYEGIIIRCRGGVYQTSRTTLKQMNTFKFKRMTDDEAVIIDFYEEMENQNEATVDENLGNTKRSKKQAGLVGKSTLGGLVVRSANFRVPFNVGTGFDHAQRKALWRDRKSLVGKTITYKYFDYGLKDAPKPAVFKDFRNIEIDG